MEQLDLQFSDVVLFELPTFEAAQAFPAEVGAETDGLALLLRQAQELLAELDLLAIVFTLDGRSYVLAAAEPVYERTEKQAA